MALRNISSWAIRNPIPPIVLFAALMLAGIVSFMDMNLNDSPEITFPGVVVAVSQPGAAPSEMESQITQRVEAAVRSLEGVEEIDSTIDEGDSTTFIQFSLQTPVDRATTDVRDAISQIRGQLPDGILEPQIIRAQNKQSIANWAVSATDMTLVQLSWFVKNEVSRRLLAIDGMQSVTTPGAVNREIRVILDPARMQAQGVTASQINAQLSQINTNAAGGRAEIAGTEQAVRVIGNAPDAYALSQVQISLGNGRSVRLADVATVKDYYGELRSQAFFNGKPTIGIGIIRSRGGSDAAIYHAAAKVLAQIEKEYPGVHFIRRTNSVDYTEQNYKAAMRAMIEGAVLAVVVVFLFLRDRRATMISALAIPLSAIPTFWIMSLMGFTLNFMTLLALSLVAGVLVDDAIVEIENIVRHMRMGKSAYQASMDAADEIGLAVVATTFSIVAVFLPVGLMPGIAGQFFKNFGLTVVVAVLMSLGVARLITPMIAAYVLKSGGGVEHHGGPVTDAYLRVLRWTLNNRWKTMGVGALALVATVVAFATLPFTMQPPQNKNESRADVNLTPGSTLEETRRVTDKALAILKRQPEVATAMEYINPAQGEIVMTLKPERTRTSIQFERDLAPQLSAIPDARISFESQSWGGSSRDLSITLAGEDPVALTRTAQKVADAMKALPGIRLPRVEGDLPRPEITIKPRLDLAADMGVTTAALSQTIRIATLGDIDQNAAKFSLSDRQVPIRVMLDENSRRTLSTIQNLPVPTTRGTSVPLKVVADIGFGAGPSEIKRFNQERQAVVSADLAPGSLAGEEHKKVMALPIMQHLPEGVHYASSGDAKFQAEMVRNFIMAVVAGILLVFAVLVLLYRRVMPPFVNLGSLMLAPLGGLLALHIVGMPVSMFVLIGLLMLLGIVAKNSILLIDFAIEEVRAGVPLRDAILEAGHKRAQPIVMTTVAMIAGMLPTALAIGGDGSWNQPMAVTVIGGLILSTLLTLLIVPAAFSLADGAERWIGPRLGRLLGGEDRSIAAHPQPAE